MFNKKDSRFECLSIYINYVQFILWLKLEKKSFHLFLAKFYMKMVKFGLSFWLS